MLNCGESNSNFRWYAHVSRRGLGKGAKHKWCMERQHIKGISSAAACMEVERKDSKTKTTSNPLLVFIFQRRNQFQVDGNMEVLGLKFQKLP